MDRNRLTRADWTSGTEPTTGRLIRVSMDLGRWQQIDRLLSEALKREPGERKNFLQQACTGDDELLQEVSLLLEAHDRAGGFMEEPALDQAARLPPPSLIGRNVGPFEILSLLGRGGMGEVYKVRDPRLDRINALKILPSEVARDPDRLRRFIREAKAASALNHPNIATIYEIGHSDGIQWIAMELVEGQTLAERMKDRPLKLEEILDISIQAAEALAEAHSKGVIHRDIKPANLMLTPKGVVKILDFGLAKRERQESPATDADATETHTVPGMVMGTARYMSPEQVLGQPVDRRTDIFSLGVVLYEMAIGQPPFRGESHSAVLDAIVHQTPAWPPRLHGLAPEETKRIVGKCLEKFREMRYDAASDLCADLKRLKRDAEPRNVAISAPLTKPDKRWFLPGIGIVLALVGLLAVLGFWFLRHGRETPEVSHVAVPLTSYPGFEAGPSFSPDGTQVAFSWYQEGQGNHLYIKQVGVEPPFQLTNAAADDKSPAWSPDGQAIAFIRILAPQKAGLFLIPQRGGTERQLDTLDVSDIPLHHNWQYLAWTPDSKWLVYPCRSAGDPSYGGLFLISVETGEKRRLTTPPPGPVGDTSAAFSPDGGTLAFCRRYSMRSDLFLLHLGEDRKPRGEPRKVDTGNNSFALGVAWTPDGQEIVFSSGDGSKQSLWRMDVSKEGKPVRVELASDSAFEPAISRSGNRLAYSVQRFDFNIRRIDLKGPGLKPGSPYQFIFSTKWDCLPAYSPDSKRIAFVSDRSGPSEIWICDADGRNPVKLTSIGGDQPAWSPDSQQIAFCVTQNGIQNVYVVSASGGAPRQLTFYPFDSIWPSWSRDGRWIYMISGFEDKLGVWKLPAQGGEAVRVTYNKQPDVPKESPDGKFIYCARGYPLAVSVWRMPLGGGEEVKVIDSVGPVASWTMIPQGIYYLTYTDDRAFHDLCFYEFATSRTRKVQALGEVNWMYGITASPDGRTVLYSQLDEAGSDLMLVENFR